MAKKLLGMVSLLLALICVMAACDFGGTTGGGTTATSTTASSTATSTTASTTSAPASSTQGSQNILPDVSAMSETDWKNALDLSIFSEITLNVCESEVTADYAISVVGSIKFVGNTADMDLVMVVNGEESVVKEQEKCESVETVCDTACSDTMRGFFDQIASLSDLGYSRFTYDDTTSSYYASFDIYDVLCNVNLYFENGKIAKWTVVNAEPGSSTLNGVYTFNYNEVKSER